MNTRGVKKYIVFFLSICFVISIFMFTPIKASAITTDTDGDWGAKYFRSDWRKPTIQADYVVRVGDIDDFGLGWVYTSRNFFERNRPTINGNNSESWTKIDPFSGESTSAHYWGSGDDANDNFQWEKINTNEPSGLDRIITVSSYGRKTNISGIGEDGYSTRRIRMYSYPYYKDAPRITPEDTDGRICINHYIKKIISDAQNEKKNFMVKGAKLQMFVDDFQPREGGAASGGAIYQVKFIGDDKKAIRIPELEEQINHLNQTGPIGKLITFDIPSKYFDIIRNNNNLYINIDDPETGAGEGYAIDFVKLLINPRDSNHIGNIKGTIIDAVTGKPIEKAYVEVNQKWETLTDKYGKYEIIGVDSGYASVKAYKAGEYEPQIKNVDILDNNTMNVDFQLQPINIINNLFKLNKTATNNIGKEGEEEFEVTLTLENINSDIYTNISDILIEDEIAEQFYIIPNSYKASLNEKDKTSNVEVQQNNLAFRPDTISKKGDIFKITYKIKRKSLDIKSGVYPTSRKPAVLKCKLTRGGLPLKDALLEFPQIEVKLANVDIGNNQILKMGIFVKNNPEVGYIKGNQASTGSLKVTMSVPLDMGILVQINTINPKLNLDIIGDYKKQTINFKIYELKNGRIQDLKAPEGKLTLNGQSFTITNQNYVFQKDKQYIIVYTIKPLDVKAGSIQNKAQIDSRDKKIQILNLNITDLPILQ